jgi:hypothetical protein
MPELWLTDPDDLDPLYEELLLMPELWPMDPLDADLTEGMLILPDDLEFVL